MFIKTMFFWGQHDWRPFWGGPMGSYIKEQYDVDLCFSDMVFWNQQDFGFGARILQSISVYFNLNQHHFDINCFFFARKI